MRAVRRYVQLTATTLATEWHYSTLDHTHRVPFWDKGTDVPLFGSAGERTPLTPEKILTKEGFPVRLRAGSAALFSKINPKRYETKGVFRLGGLRWSCARLNGMFNETGSPARAAENNWLRMSRRDPHFSIDGQVVGDSLPRDLGLQRPLRGQPRLVAHTTPPELLEPKVTLGLAGTIA